MQVSFCSSFSLPYPLYSFKTSIDKTKKQTIPFSSRQQWTRTGPFRGDRQDTEWSIKRTKKKTRDTNRMGTYSVELGTSCRTHCSLYTVFRLGGERVIEKQKHVKNNNSSKIKKTSKQQENMDFLIVCLCSFRDLIVFNLFAQSVLDQRNTYRMSYYTAAMN